VLLLLLLLLLRCLLVVTGRLYLWHLLRRRLPQQVGA
jgi:hypothetical protein